MSQVSYAPEANQAGQIPDAHERIAELEQTVRLLRAQVSMYAQALDTVPDLVLIKGPQSRIVHANRAFRDYYGMSQEQLRDLVDAPFSAPDHTQQYVRDDAQVFSTGQPLTIPHEPATRFDGAVRFFHTVKAPIYGEDGAVTQTVGVSHDITGSEEMQAALNASNDRYRHMVANVPGMVYQFRLAPDGTPSFHYVSEGCREIYGLSPEQIEDDAALILSVVHPDDQAEFGRSVRASGEELTPWRWEGRVVLEGGAQKWLQGAARPSHRPDGTLVWDGLLIDISARKQAEAALRAEREQAEREQLRLHEQIIQAQAVALAELSTPLIPISEQVVVMPLVGAMDSQRAQHVLETLLHGIEQQRARVAILDITGVPVVDTQVAQVLVRAAQASQLIGARVILTGIRPEIAQTLVGLGIDLGSVTTYGTLQQGVARAIGR
ncbi:MAG TPA: PAS domain-containing protein [Roseiflexaceae bacterium]|nr:PAS domain-containing protein [Roseiflexaceae bacterium]